MSSRDQTLQLHSVDRGSGPPVVMFHCNTSSSAQWARLADDLARDFRTIAVDSLGAGNSPPFPKNCRNSFEIEIDAIEASLCDISEPLILVGHSYGGALALQYALKHQNRIRAIVVYEPALFALAVTGFPSEDPVSGIRGAAAAASAASANGDDVRAARIFIDFWAGPGAWDAMHPKVQKYVLGTIADVPIWRDILFSDPIPLSTYRNLDCPVLFLSGKLSPRSSRSVAEVLLPNLRNVSHVDFDGLGHMGPVTHPELVNDRISEFLVDL